MTGAPAAARFFGGRCTSRFAVPFAVPFAALCVAAVLAGCGLPLQDGVQAPGEVPVAQRLPERISVLPPGPQPGAEPEDIVRGFLAAQSSTRDDHGIARSFLAPAQRAAWDDDAGVTVYDPSTAGEAEPEADGDDVVLTLSLDVVGYVGRDGAASLSNDPVEQPYRLSQVDGQWRIVDLPPGLTLTAFARDGSFAALDVFFLAPPVPGSPPHLVADRVLLPVDDDRVRVLVEQLLSGPSSGLAGNTRSALTAVPEGTALLGIEADASGEITVDLSQPVEALPEAERQALSAQLVWTLRQVPGFTRLRLTVQDRPFQVAGEALPQSRTAWAGYDPAGSRESPPAHGLGPDGRLRALDTARADPSPTQPVELADTPGVVDAASNPRSPELAVLTEAATTTTGTGTVRTLRVGPMAGPLGEVGLQGPDLRSVSWGSGERGVWLLRTGDDAVLLVPPAGRPVEVAVDNLPELDGSSVLRVSRDGVRLGLVADGVLWVGRVVPGDRPAGQPVVVAPVPADSAADSPADSAAGIRVVDLRPIASDVLDVAWRTGTSLAVLSSDEDPPLLPLVELSVDGTSAIASGLVGVAAGSPVAVAAYREQPLLVEVQVGERSTTYGSDDGRPFEVRLLDSARPFYPG